MEMVLKTEDGGEEEDELYKGIKWCMSSVIWWRWRRRGIKYKYVVQNVCLSYKNNKYTICLRYYI